MKLYTDEQRDQLKANGSPENAGFYHIPVVKWFTPDANATWLVTEILDENEEEAFGLCDLGLGFPELGYISISEIQSFRGNLGLPIERDLSFEGKFPIDLYYKLASKEGRIVTNENQLAQFQAELKIAKG